MAYDAGRGCVVLFGGRTAGDEELLFQDAWEWCDGTWSDRTPSGTSPPARWGGAMAYDPLVRRVVLFGGSGPLADTWEWDGSGWIDRTPSGTGPPARTRHGLVFDETTRTSVLFGGMGEAPNTLLGDTWEREASPARQPALTFEASALGAGVADISGLRVRAFCGGVHSPYGASDTGATLLGWSTRGPGPAGVGWVRLATAVAGLAPAPARLPDASTALLDWSAPSAEDAMRFVSERDRRLAFQCRPAGPSGSGEAQVALDYVEVRVRYRTTVQGGG